MAEHYVGDETSLLQRKGGSRNFLTIQHPGFGFSEVVMCLTRRLALGNIGDLFDAWQYGVLPLSEKRDLVALLGTEMTSEMKVLEVLMCE